MDVPIAGSSKSSKSLDNGASKVWRHTLVGHSACIKKLRDLIEPVAQSVATVLISGESGAGKKVHPVPKK